ncbi:MAG: menaquinone biosynthesis protein [Limisphaerales bacterium]
MSAFSRALPKIGLEFFSSSSLENGSREIHLKRKLGNIMSIDAQKFRIGSVKYLNAAPLTRGLESKIIFATPAKLAEMLRRDELDAALVSITEVLFNDRYDILDDVAIASFGEVFSVILAHKKPLEEAKKIFCDTASLTSVNLLKVLLAETKLFPQFKPLENYAAAPQKDFALLIGDPAIDFQRSPRTHKIFDLGAAWFELTNLPFVYAVWALRRGIENSELCRELREAKKFGLQTLDDIVKTREEYDEDFRRNYFERNIRYHLAEDEKRGIAKFCKLLCKHGLGAVHEPKFVS